jgi:hypothetical protein
MRREKSKQCNDLTPSAIEERDSPTIKDLIEKLDRDMEETQRNASKAR